MLNNNSKSTSAVALLLIIIGTLAGFVSGQEQTKPDLWQPIRFLVGEWQGTAEGQSGTGTVIRSYSFVLKDRFVHEKNGIIQRTELLEPQEIKVIEIAP